MLSPLRNRFGIPGVISVIALVFAMLGGAYAASDNGGSGSKATASAKAKKGPRGPRGPKGPAGPQGPAGPAGTNGKDGAPGQAGTPGQDGADGVSVSSEEFAGTKEGHCSGQGGSKFTAADGSTFACNGQTGFTDTLPSGKTETGGWAVNGTEADEFGLATAISFAIPLAAPIPAENVHYITDASTETNCATRAEGIANPTAAAGHLCVYEGISLLGPATIKTLQDSPGTGLSGALLSFAPPSGVGLAVGSFAVTAP